MPPPAVAEADVDAPDSSKRSALLAELPSYAVIGVVLAVVYRLTLLPGIGVNGDTTKFQFVGKVLGIPHATGYPLYVVVNRVFTTVFPFGTLATRANVLSAACTIVAAWFGYALMRELGLRRSASVAAVLTCCFTWTLWLHSIFAEVYTLNLLFTTAVLFFLVRWHRHGRSSDLLVGLGLYALSFGNHMTMITLLPAVAVLVLSRRREALTVRNVLVVGGFVVAGAAQYGFLVWRARVGAAYMEHAPTDLAGIWHVASGATFRGLMFSFTPWQVLTDRVPLMAGFVRDQYGLWLVPAVYGLAQLRRLGTVTIALLAGAAANVGYAMNYDLFDIYIYLIPSYFVVAVFLAAGLDGILSWAASRRRVSLVALASLPLAPLSLLVLNYRDVDYSDNTGVVAPVLQTMDALGTNAILLTRDYHLAQYLWYHLIGHGIGVERGLHVAAVYEPETVAAYLRGQGPLDYTPGRYRWEYDPRKRHLYGAAPPGIAVYVSTQADADEFVRLGVTTTAVGGLWRLSA